MRILILFCLLSQAAFGTTYFIDPNKGNDSHSGKVKNMAWKSFAPLSHYELKAGDKLLIYPGKFDTSLQLSAQGTAVKPVVVLFAPGTYDFYDTNAYRAKLNISNTNDVPDGLKSIAIYVTNSSHVKLQGYGAKLIMHAKMVETYVDHSQNINIEGLSYDYATPTVSEFTVSDLTEHTADLQVNKDSHYAIKDSVLYWEGEGWQYKNSWYWQEYQPTDGFVTRTGLSFGKSKFEAIGPNVIRVHFPVNPGLKLGYVYQTRDVTRDCAGLFLQRSKNISLNKIRIYFMHGMGVVSQFCENILIDSLTVKPADGRTCAAWADILHFAGCKGLIDVRNSYLSAANDDAINVHGIHLRIMEQRSPNQLKVRFMHDQTYGFMPYAPGDSIELVHGASLLPFATNIVKAAEMLNDREVLLTLQKPVKTTLVKDDVVENISWTPKVKIQHTTITSIPTRGILITSRQPALISHNRFIRLAGSGILVADDAESWYESGPVKNLRILNNDFMYCGGPVINIHPENTRHDGPVHRNISIANNKFLLKGTELLSAKSTSGIKLSHNQISFAPGMDTSRLFRFENCADVINDWKN
jgi:hypothetical protein